MTLEELEKIVQTRAAASPDESWTAKLLAKGPEKAAEKFGEEAIEAIIEAVKNDPDKLASEAADVLFHLLVMLHARGVTVAQVMDVLASRQSQSGIAEKAARPK
ncbi:phosphoribosyl-ATP diphosphatase [Sagittula sp. S175]|uniref:phosphoribosyl-ATP diphosphatase n=1 Tax=Sagittula sp. S175 TaxID=3415129 RepID=UPI003C7B1832